MRKPSSRLAALALGAFLITAGVTCADSATGPNSKNGLTTLVGLNPVFSKAAADVYRNLVSFQLTVDNIHVVLLHADGSVAVDTVVAVAAGQDSVVLELKVDLASTQEQLTANIDLRDGDEVLFSGTQLITAKVGFNTGSSSPPSIPLTYSGPGATVTSLDVQPDTTISAANTLQMRPVALNSNNQPVSNLVLQWSLNDATLGAVSSTGVFTPAGKRGTATITAELPTGLKGSATVNVVPVPTGLFLISGGDQTGVAGATLAQPFVVEVRASDGLPVPGIAVAMGVTSGGGSVGPVSAVSDANGRVSATLTLGTTAGANAVQITSGALTAVSVSATGTAGPPARLGIVQQPSATATSGATLGTQPTVRVVDANGNPAAVANLSVTAQLSPVAGRTLQGTVTRSTNASGVAVFTDLKIVGPAGTTALTFTQGPLTSVTSTDITLAVGAPATLSANVSLTTTDSAGANLGSTVLPNVTVRDASNNAVPAVTVRFVRRGGGGSSINAQANAEVQATSDGNGVAALSARRLQTTTGFDTVLVTVDGLSDTVRFVASVTNASATQLVYVQQPTSSTGGALIAPSVTVEVRDQFGNRTVTGVGATTSVTLALAGGAAGAILGPNAGALTKAAVAGLATFSVNVDKVGTGYALTASAASLTGSASTTFNIAAGPPAQLLAMSGNDVGALPGDEIVMQVRVADAGGNSINAASVTFTVDSGGGTLDSSPSPATRTTNAGGLASVDFRPGTGQQRVIANVGAITLPLRVFLAAKVVMVTQPSLTPQSGIPLVQQPAVRLLDVNNNIVRRAGAVILADYERIPFVDAFMQLTGLTQRPTDANGIATFTDLTFTGDVEQNVQLLFLALGGLEPDPSIATASSATIVLQPGAPTQIQGLDGVQYFRLTDPGTQDLTVVTRDGFNNVPGASVTFSVVQGACTLASPATVTTNSSGQGSVNVNSAAVSLTSCVVRAIVNVPPPQGGGEVFTPTVYQRLYVAPGTFKVWTGAFDTNWESNFNWFANNKPFGGEDVFIPGAAEFDNKPTMPTELSATGFNALFIESGAVLTLNNTILNVADSLVADGKITGAGNVVLNGAGGTKLRGTIESSLDVGTNVAPCLTGGAFKLSGSLTVTGTVLVYCTLTLDTAVAVTLNDSLAVQPFGRLNQSNGSIVVVGNANFAGFQTLTGGILDLWAHMTTNTNCESTRFLASGAHTTRFFASMVPDTALVTLGGPCVSSTGVTFGNVQLLTGGRTVRFTSSSTGSIDVGDLLVLNNSSMHLALPLSITAGGVSGKGVTIEPAGVLKNEGGITVTNGGACSPIFQGSALLTGVICLTP